MPPISAAEFDRLVKQLDAANFKQRDDAQAKLDAAEKLTMLSLVKGGGAGAGLPGADAPTAQKGASAGGGEPFKMPSKAELEKMTDEQRNELALKSVHIDHSIPIPADQFDRTGNEVLMAARKLAEVSA